MFGLFFDGVWMCKKANYKYEARHKLNENQYFTDLK